MKAIIIAFVFFSFCLFSCGKREQQITYYENGGIKYKAQVIDGKLDGLLLKYYPNGMLESKTYWKNDFRDGISEYYFDNGKIKERTVFKDDKRNGPSKTYYENGNLKNEVEYADDKIIGVGIFYFSNGRVEQKHFYKNGLTTYILRFDSAGTIVTSSPLPIINDVEDTIRIGNLFQTEITFDYNLSGDIKLLVGPIKKNSELIDTIEILTPDKEGKFVYSTKPTQKGENIFSFKFKHTPKEGDTISVDELSQKHFYYVK